MSDIRESFVFVDQRFGKFQSALTAYVGPHSKWPNLNHCVYSRAWIAQTDTEKSSDAFERRWKRKRAEKHRLASVSSFSSEPSFAISLISRQCSITLNAMMRRELIMNLFITVHLSSRSSFYRERTVSPLSPDRPAFLSTYRDFPRARVVR